MKNGESFKTDFPEGVKMYLRMYRKDSQFTFLGADVQKQDPETTKTTKGTLIIFDFEDVQLNMEKESPSNLGRVWWLSNDHFIILKV